MILPAIARCVYRAISAKARELGCDVLAIGGIADHVHVLLKFTATLSVADLVKGIKGTSSRVVNDQTPFKWQGAYGAFTVSANDVEMVIAYISNQKTHHADHTWRTDFEACDVEK